MDELGELANKIFSLLKGNGLKIKIFDTEGAETTDPTAGRRFFSASPNVMITIDEDASEVQISKGKDTGESLSGIEKNIRKLADSFLMNTDIKVFGKAIEPRSHSYQAKMKGTTMNETTTPSSQLMGKMEHLMTQTQGAMTEVGFLKNIAGSNRRDIRTALNALVTKGVLKATGSTDSTDGSPFYELAMDEAIMESFSKMFGSLKTSQQTLENVRILVKHKTPVDENVRGSRTRHISAIFLESNGERFRFPHAYLPGARAMAQHMAHGGTMTDKVGMHINESTSNLLKLQSFNRYVVTNNLINEDSSGIVETVKENIETIRTELKKLTGSKTYETARARLETFERETLAEDDTTQLKDLFTIRRFDEKFEEVLPIVKQLVQEKDTFHKRIEEAAANPVMLRRETINTTPMFEFASENARLGFKLNELALRIMENDELSGFVNKIGTKLCKEGIVNDFEKAVMKQIFENMQVAQAVSVKKEIKESADLSVFFDKYIKSFY
jgi:hypothetical protein